MSSSAEIYAKEIHDQLLRYATWFPTNKVKVGDVGTLRNSIFDKEGDLKTNFWDQLFNRKGPGHRRKLQVYVSRHK